MAIIKCPECGHEVSDHAETCPSCGIAIAGHIARCPQCGYYYFNNLTVCPHCHAPRPADAATASQQNSVLKGNSGSADNVNNNSADAAHTGVQGGAGGGANGNNGASTEGNPNKNRNIIIAVAVAVIVVIVVAFNMCGNDDPDAKGDDKEQTAYEYAMQSDDPAVLQSYLDTYTDADEAHRDSIMAHLQRLQSIDADWNNALVSGTKNALEEYIEKHPDSPHKQEIWDKIDSIDWSIAKSKNTPEAYQTYISDHSDGKYADQAEDAIKKIKTKDVQPEEKQMVSGLFKRFFQSINTRNDGALTGTCEDVLTSFLGKPQATKNDVVTFMNKIYKADVSNMNWFINNDYDIKKREVGDEEYEYQVTFSAQQVVDKTTGEQKKTKFKIKAKVSPEGKISEMNMSKIIE